jgi:chromosome partitioning protein
MIISLLNQKGGVGKTTLTVSIAVNLAKKGYKVLLVDSDPQGSALNWSANREDETPFSIMAMPKAILHKELPKFEDDYDIILIDGPPSVFNVTRSAVMVSDLVLIPVQPSPYDIWAVEPIVELVKDSTLFDENKQAFFIINRKIVNTAIGREVVKVLQEFDLPVMKSHICQRVSFAESAGAGQTITETEPKSTAGKEIEKLTNEILKIIGKK